MALKSRTFILSLMELIVAGKMAWQPGVDRH